MAARIEAIEECLRIIRKYLQPEATYQADLVEMKLILERCVERVIQAMLDIGAHIVSAKRLGRPERYDDIFQILATNEILPIEFISRIKGLAGLRNIIVHEYISIDHSLLERHATSLLEDSSEYIRLIREFIAQEAKDNNHEKAVR